MRRSMCLSMLFVPFLVGHAYGQGGGDSYDSGLYIQADAGSSLLHDTESTFGPAPAGSNAALETIATVGRAVGYNFDSVQLQTDVSYRQAVVETIEALGRQKETGAYAAKIHSNANRVHFS